VQFCWKEEAYTPTSKMEMPSRDVLPQNTGRFLQNIREVNENYKDYSSVGNRPLLPKAPAVELNMVPRANIVLAVARSS
jgi:hypothetical protein